MAQRRVWRWNRFVCWVRRGDARPAALARSGALCREGRERNRRSRPVAMKLSATTQSLPAATLVFAGVRRQRSAARRGGHAALAGAQHAERHLARLRDLLGNQALSQLGCVRRSHLRANVRQGAGDTWPRYGMATGVLAVATARPIGVVSDFPLDRARGATPPTSDRINRSISLPRPPNPALVLLAPLRAIHMPLPRPVPPRRPLCPHRHLGSDVGCHHSIRPSTAATGRFNSPSML